MGSFTVGELAYFIDTADQKGGHEREVRVAWTRLSEKLQTASALDLGKLQRWIVSPKYPHLREKFSDVLVVAEKRLAEMGGAS
jgi:hypothetical protein